MLHFCGISRGSKARVHLSLPAFQTIFFKLCHIDSQLQDREYILVFMCGVRVTNPLTYFDPYKSSEFVIGLACL